MLIIVLKQSNRFDMKVNASLLMKKILSANYYFYQFWLEFYTEAPKGYKTPKDTLVLKIYTLVFFFFWFWRAYLFQSCLLTYLW